MKKETLYKVAIAVLLIVNILQLIPFFLGPKPPKRNNDFKQHAIELLQLTKEQTVQFDSIAQQHRKQMNQINDNQIEITSRYFANPSDELLNEISTLETLKIKTTQNHFLAVKSILNPNQIDAFHQFKMEALQTIINQKPIQNKKEK